MKVNKVHKLIGLMVCISFTLLLGSIFASSPAKAAANPVELYSAQINTFHEKDVPVGYNAQGYIAVNNSNLTGKVSIHYQYSYGDDSWQNVQAKFIGTANGKQLWHFETPRRDVTPYKYYNFACQFAIKYRVNGKVYWNNNNGNDYFIRSSNIKTRRPYVLKESNVIATNTSSYSPSSDLDTLEGDIILKDIEYEKDVKVIYTFDNWATTHKTSANYETKYNNNLERWNFKIKNIPNDSKVKYCIAYTVNDNTYWAPVHKNNYVFNN